MSTSATPRPHPRPFTLKQYARQHIESVIGEPLNDLRVPLVPAQPRVVGERPACLSELLRNQLRQLFSKLFRPLSLFLLASPCSPMLLPRFSLVVCFLLCRCRRALGGLVEPELIEVINAEAIQVVELIFLIDAVDLARTLGRGVQPLAFLLKRCCRRSPLAGPSWIHLTHFNSAACWAARSSLTAFATAVALNDCTHPSW